MVIITYTAWQIEMNNYISTVSYTHLDVYKRQLLLHFTDGYEYPCSGANCTVFSYLFLFDSVHFYFTCLFTLPFRTPFYTVAKFTYPRYSWVRLSVFGRTSHGCWNNQIIYKFTKHSIVLLIYHFPSFFYSNSLDSNNS